MGSILVVAEIQKGKVREASYELVSFARKVGEATGREVKSLVLGQGVSGLAEELSKKGGGEVFAADDAALANYNAGGHFAAVKAAIDAAAPDLILLSNTPSGWDVAPRVAATLDAAFVSDCFDIEVDGGELVFLRRFFNGKLDARLRPAGLPIVATMQPGATAAFSAASEGKVTPLSITVGEGGTKFIEVKAASAKGVDLTKAEIIISGGRSLGGPEKFEEVIKPLADALGGAMGASRPVVDAGWLPHAHQVGSSGQVVSPKLYVACGISGAIQHLVGMKSSNFIIAINKDPDAPIFEVANLGVVGDLFEVVPKLTEAVKTAKG
ncbi:electron transfer flavoprotein subunit alpha/FixB family protein [Myxococcota bacterium]|nr:electron transfer flavoprotein subunit alpha/FixB family protein [Myxococcota bacterium]MCZ7620457.1 electron transfer flavoprotein subunit alpha/FixB family protein [Myxococcota bacterium]